MREKMKKKISALREQLQASEGYKTRVAELELEKQELRENVHMLKAQLDTERENFRKEVNAIVSDYEQRIQEIETARKKVQTKLDLNEADIPRLQNEITEKVQRIDELQSWFCRLWIPVYILAMLIALLFFVLYSCSFFSLLL